MNDTAALAEIHRLARLEYTQHAAMRMDERGAKREDVRAALLSATSARTPARTQGGYRWRVEGGRDRAGDELIVVVALEADVIVITLF